MEDSYEITICVENVQEGPARFQRRNDRKALGELHPRDDGRAHGAIHHEYCARRQFTDFPSRAAVPPRGVITECAQRENREWCLNDDAFNEGPAKLKHDQHVKAA